MCYSKLLNRILKLSGTWQRQEKAGSLPAWSAAALLLTTGFVLWAVGGWLVPGCAGAGIVMIGYIFYVIFARGKKAGMPEETAVKPGAEEIPDRQQERNG